MLESWLKHLPSYVEVAKVEVGHEGFPGLQLSAARLWQLLRCSQQRRQQLDQVQSLCCKCKTIEAEHFFP